MKIVTYTVHIEPADEGGYWARFPALPGCFTQGETLEEVLIMAKEALEGYLDVLRQHGQPIPIESPLSNRVGFDLPLSAYLSK
jgi:predicted RNase H-like HicB family nuclease